MSTSLGSVQMQLWAVVPSGRPGDVAALEVGLCLAVHVVAPGDLDGDGCLAAPAEERSQVLDAALVDVLARAVDAVGALDNVGGTFRGVLEGELVLLEVVSRERGGDVDEVVAVVADVHDGVDVVDALGVAVFDELAHGLELVVGLDGVLQVLARGAALGEGGIGEVLEEKHSTRGVVGVVLDVAASARCVPRSCRGSCARSMAASESLREEYMLLVLVARWRICEPLSLLSKFS